MQYLHYSWDETRGDAFDHWGTASYFFEIDSDGNVLRQLEQYHSGVRLAYTEHHHTDIYGMLTDKPFVHIEPPLVVLTRHQFKNEWQAESHHNAEARVIDQRAGTPYFDPQKSTFTLRGQQCVSFPALVEEVNHVLFQKYSWNGNLDALNDMLSGGFGTPLQGFQLVWQDAQIAAQSLGYRETVLQLQQRHMMCHPENKAQVLQQIALAHKQKGTTVFDWIIEIMAAQQHVSLILQ